MPCSWCGVEVGADEGFRASEPEGERKAAFCRLEHVVPWAIQGAALGAGDDRAPRRARRRPRAAARTAAARWATAACCSSATAASTASPTRSAASTTCCSGRRPAGAGRRRASGGLFGLSSALRVGRCAASTASPRERVVAVVGALVVVLGEGCALLANQGSLTSQRPGSNGVASARDAPLTRTSRRAPPRATASVPLRAAVRRKRTATTAPTPAPSPAPPPRSAPSPPPAATTAPNAGRQPHACAIAPADRAAAARRRADAR